MTLFYSFLVNQILNIFTYFIWEKVSLFPSSEQQQAITSCFVTNGTSDENVKNEKTACPPGTKSCLVWINTNKTLYPNLLNLKFHIYIQKDYNKYSRR